MICCQNKSKKKKGNNMPQFLYNSTPKHKESPYSQAGNLLIKSQRVIKMEFKNLFDKFSTCGKLLLPDSAFSFDDIPWSVHPAFDGVELKEYHYFRSDRRSNSAFIW